MKLWDAYQLCTITLLAGFPYIFSLNGDFVFDDSEAILKNNNVVSGSWTDAFYNDFWGTSINSTLSHKSYRPLTILSFKVNHLMNGKVLSAKQFKITNLILHVTCCLLLYKTYREILKRMNFKCRKISSDIAFFGTIMFCTHPIHVEAVSGIVGRADILAAITFFSAFLIYNKAMRKSQISIAYLLIAVILAAVAMLFKENGITVLGLCVIYELIINVTTNGISKPTNLYFEFGKIMIPRKSVTRIICLFIAISMILYLRWLVMGGVKPKFKNTDNPAAFATDVFAKVATINYVYFMNLLLLIWPYWLGYDWSMGCVPLIESVTDGRIICIVILYLFGCYTLTSLVGTREPILYKRLIIISLGVMIIPFLPAANIFYPVGFVIAERIMYIPSAGYCLLVAIGLHKLINNKRISISKQIVSVSYYLVILIYSMRSFQRSFEWQSEYKLFTSGLQVCPLNAKVHYNVAKVADARGNLSWAMEEYGRAIRLYPDYYQAMNNYANLLKKQKNFKEAEFYLKKAISINNEFPAAWMNLGIVLASTKKYAESEKAYLNALKFRKNYPDCYYNLGNLYLEQNLTEMAVDNWFKAIHLNPKHNSSWTNLLALLDNTGQIEKALQIIPQALQVLPESPSVIFAIANIYGKIDEYYEAEKYFLKAITLFGSNVKPIHFANLGVLYHRWKKFDLAEKMYIRALDIQPSFRSARVNLESLKKLKRRNKV